MSVADSFLPTARVAAAPPARERWLTAALTGGVAGVLLLLAPNPGDAPAHLYRTFLVDHGVWLWDNLWYAGQYPLASYSVLYYLPAAAVGNRTLVVFAAILSSLLFAAIAFHEWGARVRWATRAFGVLAAAPLFTGLYSYSLGLAALLGALRALQTRRLAFFAVLAALTVGFSPLAFAFLLAILVAVAGAQRRVSVRWVVVGLTLAVLVAFELVLLDLFPSRGSYPFDYRDLIGVVAVCTLGALLASRADGNRVVLWFFVVWGVGSLVAFGVPSAIGDNWTRLRAFVLPLMLVAAVQARFRPRPLVVVAIAAAAFYNIFPYVMLIPYGADSRPAGIAFWRPALGFLGRQGPPLYRVEVVPTSEHWESYWLPRAGYPLARGWYRQLDRATNPILYSRHLTGTTYLAWARRIGVRYILLPNTHLDPVGGPAEARIVTSGIRGLRLVFSDPSWRIYRVAGSSPLLHGRHAATLERFGHDVVSGTVSAPGIYRLSIRYTPYWEASRATICLRASADGMTLLRARSAGPFVLRTPSGLDALFDSVTHSPSKCRR